MYMYMYLHMWKPTRPLFFADAFKNLTLPQPAYAGMGPGSAGHPNNGAPHRRR